VGNDVIDLLDPRLSGKAHDERFTRRVLDPSEQALVAAAPDPDRVLFMCWAAKEAAYKVVSKLLGAPPVFQHRAYLYRGAEVEHEGTRYPLHIKAVGTTLHAVATAGANEASVFAEDHALDHPGSPWDASLDELIGRLTPREGDAVHSLASAAVRIGARRTLASVLQVAEHRVQIVCAPGVTGRRPPHVLLDGVPGPADVSLSHHGTRIGWAILVPVSSPAVGS